MEILEQILKRNLKILTYIYIITFTCIDSQFLVYFPIKNTGELLLVENRIKKSSQIFLLN